jgi:hypothetical protein
MEGASDAPTTVHLRRLSRTHAAPAAGRHGRPDRPQRSPVHHEIRVEHGPSGARDEVRAICPGLRERAPVPGRKGITAAPPLPRAGVVVARAHREGKA